MSKLVRDMRRSGVLAKCEFEADGEKMVALFSLSSKKWELVYPGMRLASRVKVPAGDVKSFFESKFFSKFLARCNEIVSKVYGS